MKIHKKLQCFALATAAGLLASNGVAQLVNITHTPGYFVSNGEFTISPVQGAGYAPVALVGGGYETFCVYRDAGIGVPGTYLASINAAGIYLPANLTISKGSAWLYSHFSDGTLPGYRYAGAAIFDNGPTNPSERANDADALQLAFWTLEGQYWYGLGDPNPLSANTLNNDLTYNAYLVQAANAFGGGTNGLLAAMQDNSPGDYSVGVLNMNYTNGTVAQPLLVRLPNVCNVSICGYVFADCNGDGDLTAADVGLTNVPVKLLNAAGQQVSSITTGTNGGYCFTGLVAGDYKVVVTPPAGYKQTIASTGHYWKDCYGRRCWVDNDGNSHCIDNGIECWRGKDGCTHWKDSYGRDCWKDNYNNYRCQPLTYKPCYATNNDNTLCVTVTNCQNKADVDFAYVGTTPNISVCVSGPSYAKCGQSVTYTCSITNTGNVCFQGGNVCHTIGNCFGWGGSTCTFTNVCPPLSPGDHCQITQTCTYNWWNTGDNQCQSKVTCSQPAGTSVCGQSYCNTKVSW